MAVFGYARVSSVDQNLDSQKDELKKMDAQKFSLKKFQGKILYPQS
ncbi:MAG: DNA invertase Pin-like site-specific DNA recombinase [Aureispira sp.]|jgi:DNA invertase Pin-like site-specific DNA recombinase